jgi:hypothetical protein
MKCFVATNVEKLSQTLPLATQGLMFTTGYTGEIEAFFSLPAYDHAWAHPQSPDVGDGSVNHGLANAT